MSMMSDAKKTKLRDEIYLKNRGKQQELRKMGTVGSLIYMEDKRRNV
ncbi:hypothetical protein AGMMS4952_10700 [Spirochaetia bacterium]|nr:hypothetical protein AGMMS4952_10700 [Spirochaetia bacterium]